MNNEKEQTKPKQKKPISYKIGLGILILAILCWIIAAILPFTPFSLTVKASMITGSLIVGEILFWIGAVLVGKEVVTKYKGYLNPRNWRKKREGQEDEES